MKSMSFKELPGDPAASIRIGAFELHPAERVLRTAGKAVELGARAFDLLLVLVEHEGRLANKATLLERVWPRLVVDENNLPAQIASLRRVLGAGAIRTVAGFGYRLELTISPVASSAPRQPAEPRFNPPWRTWPDRLGTLIGRDDDVRGVQAALARNGLVTVVGGAGVGKTRLAQEIAASAADLSGTPAAWVALQPITAAQHVPSAIALALGLSLPDGINGFVALRQLLEQVPVLLILDGAEHLGDSLASPLSQLVLQTQGVRALVTSQAPLGVPGETVYRLEALAVPDAKTPHAEAIAYPAVELFAKRAASADRRFELNGASTALAIQICRRLDGNPLAIELAAARVPALGIQALLERLDDRFRLLKVQGRSAEPRHGALIAALDWSYNLLSPQEQTVFNRLGAFAGSFSLQAAAGCVADQNIDTAEAIDLIGRLVDRSLVSALPVEPPRYLLLETVRFYTLGKLADNGDLAAAQASMARTLLRLLDSAYQEYWSLDEVIWLHRYEPEVDNVRAALDWAGVHDRELSVALYGSAWPLFVETDLYSEGRVRYDDMLKRLSDSLPRARTARFWEAVATYDCSRQCDRARYAAELAAAMHAAAGDARARYYSLLKLAFNCRGDDSAARIAFDAARTLEDPAWPARLLTHGALTEGALLMNAGGFSEARSAYRRAVRFALTVSERRALEASASIVELDIACGDTAAALQLGRPLLVTLRHSGRRETLFDVLVLVFSALLLAGETAEARETGAELQALAQRLDASKLYSALDAMAYLACIERRFEAAARIGARADLAHELHGQLRRRPVPEQMRNSVLRSLAEQGLAPVRINVAELRELFDEEAACSLALGLRD